jgi:hypothetical protein
MARWATVTGPIGQRQLSDDDFVWAVKAVQGESGSKVFEGEVVLWTMIRRWMSGQYAGGNTRKPFWKWMQSFSQPINPNQIGVIHAYDRTPEDPSGRIRSAERDARIRSRFARSLGWYEHNTPEVVDLVRRVFEGRVRQRYPTIVNFNKPGAGKCSICIGPIPLRGIDGRSNVFFKEPWSQRWTRSVVKMTPPSGVVVLSTGGKVALAALGLAAAAGVVWFVEKKRRT